MLKEQYSVVRIQESESKKENVLSFRSILNSEYLNRKEIVVSSQNEITV
ncbi:MAG: hypothetical protein A4E52_02122 [Pelotomaculum sp. PtaB.Bin013]|nr:MAG: hypothetical protein A4E52_02122 [Pelotomaculum sp. PtaB.Bin013]